MYKAKELKNILQCKARLSNENALIKHVYVDSRKISFAEEGLFFALQTKDRDGHSFIEEAYEQGVRNFVVSIDFNYTLFNDANFFLVQDTLKALQETSANHRQKFHYPVIGITGSNGKTIVKEWLYQLLSDDYKIVRSPRSYNSQTGVPLSVWEMSNDNDLAIFEAGISEKNEMQKLEEIIRPDIGIITNIGEAHSKNFVSNTQKLKEKVQLFKNVEILFAFYDDELIKDALPKMVASEIFSIGFSPECTLYISAKNIYEKNTEVIFYYQAKKHTLSLPFTDSASLHNCFICIALCLYLGINIEEIQKRVSKLQPLEMRMQVLPGINGCTFINDSYSLDLQSLNIALDFLFMQPNAKTVILSDIPNAENHAYEKAIDMLKNRNALQLITIGPEWYRKKEILKSIFPETAFYTSTQEFINQFNSQHFRNRTVLIKGARKFSFENIIPLFQQKIHSTFLEVNLSAIIHNIKEYRKRLLPDTKIMAMVKAFGYGSGSLEVAGILQFHKVDYLTVAYTDEAVDLKEAGIQLPVMIMNIEESSFRKIVSYGLEPEIFSFKILYNFADYLQKEGIQQYPVHIKIDTGMHRLGFEEADISSLAAFLQKNTFIQIKSVFSHLVASENAQDDAFTQKQAAVFAKCCAQLEKEVGYTFLRHLSNSAGIVRHPDLQFDMVRLGIGLYGIDSSQSNDFDLQPAISFKTTIAQIRKLKAGETVGYNRKGLLKKDAVIATIRVGYADGFKRSLGNGKGMVYVKGKMAPVVGIVCMDMTMIDITGIENVQEEDVVEIFGTHIPVEKVAEWCSTNAYEILTGIGQRVKRIYTEE